VKTILIAVGVLLVLAVNFVTYCCFRVASEEDARLEKMRAEGGEKDGI
jgi:hypothetical protein